jgi:hypothetical protein
MGVAQGPFGTREEVNGSTPRKVRSTLRHGGFNGGRIHIGFRETVQPSDSEATRSDLRSMRMPISLIL